jgi:DNA-binding XRE family transcriptional regulator
MLISPHFQDVSLQAIQEKAFSLSVLFCPNSAFPPMRLMLGLNQKELAAIAEIHLQSVGKIERGLTTKLSSHSKSGLAIALQVPVEYLEAVCRGTPIVAVSQLKFCAPCWTPGTPPDPLWMEVRAKYCFLCGSALRDRCSHCQERITSLKHRFCPFCGTAYKAET